MTLNGVQGLSTFSIEHISLQLLCLFFYREHQEEHQEKPEHSKSSNTAIVDIVEVGAPVTAKQSSKKSSAVLQAKDIVSDTLGSGKTAQLSTV